MRFHLIEREAVGFNMGLPWQAVNTRTILPNLGTACN